MCYIIYTILIIMMMIIIIISSITIITCLNYKYMDIYMDMYLVVHACQGWWFQ